MMGPHDLLHPTPPDDSQLYGIRVRDHIAIEAMKSLISRFPHDYVVDVHAIVSDAFFVADLMIRASQGEAND